MSYNPSIFTATNKPIGLTNNSTDARTLYFDANYFVFRAYVDTAEVLAYLIGNNRVGQFSIIINTGGTLVNGVITGGTNAEWWFKDGIADSNLVLKVSGGGATNTILNGTANPGSGVGNNGDFYINTSTTTIFGPKSAGAWGSGTLIIGPQGPAGTNGTNGTNGQGVPTGGTTNQVLAKIDNTNYNTQWVDETGGGTWGSITGNISDQTDLYSLITLTNRAFNPVIVFDTPFESVYTQVGNISLSLGATPVMNVTGRITIIGDGVHSLTFPAFDPTFSTVNWYNANGQTFDNTTRNVIYFEYDGNAVSYAIVKESTPDVTPPTLMSAIISNGAKNQIVLSYSELLDATSVPATTDFTANLSKAITAVSVSGSQVIVTVNSNYSYGDVPTLSYTAGGNPIQDPSHNLAANLVNQLVTNNVLPAATSLTFVGSNQIPATSVVPSALSFGSGGTDTPFSVSIWIKPSSLDACICSVGSLNSSTDQNWILQRVTGQIYFQLLHNGSQCYINSNSSVATAAWKQVIVTYDGSKLASGMKIYFNAALQAVTVGGASYAGQNAFVSDTILTIGAIPYLYNGGSPQTPAYNYLFDHAYIWNKELTAGDVTALYNGGVPPDPTTLGITAYLQARYEFDGSLADGSVNSYNLTSVVAPSYSTDVP